MFENHATKIERWKVCTFIGCMATKKLFMKLGLSAIAPVGVVVCWYFALGPFEEKIMPGIIALLCIATLTAINAMWRILPELGRDYLNMIENLYGPLTRAEVWKWWLNLTEQSGGQTQYRRQSNPVPTLDVEAIAKQVGEFPFDSDASQ